MVRIATKLTSKSTHSYAHHGVVVIRGGKVIAQGYNHGAIHAEVNALNKLWPSKRKGCKIWSIRISPGGYMKCAKPCEKCEAYLRENGIKVVYYSTAEGTIERMKL